MSGSRRRRLASTLLVAVTIVAVLGAWHQHAGAALLGGPDALVAAPARVSKAYACPACTLSHQIAAAAAAKQPAGFFPCFERGPAIAAAPAATAPILSSHTPRAPPF